MHKTRKLLSRNQSNKQCLRSKVELHLPFLDFAPIFNLFGHDMYVSVSAIICIIKYIINYTIILTAKIIFLTCSKNTSAGKGASLSPIYKKKSKCNRMNRNQINFWLTAQHLFQFFPVHPETFLVQIGNILQTDFRHKILQFLPGIPSRIYRACFRNLRESIGIFHAVHYTRCQKIARHFH